MFLHMHWYCQSNYGTGLYFYGSSTSLSWKIMINIFLTLAPSSIVKFGDYWVISPLSASKYCTCIRFVQLTKNSKPSFYIFGVVNKCRRKRSEKWFSQQECKIKFKIDDFCSSHVVGSSMFRQ